MLKKTTLSLLLVCFFIQCFSQKQGQARIDSIMAVVNGWNETNRPTDTTETSVYVELAYELHKINPDKGIAFAQKALELSEKLKWKTGVASAYNRMGLCYWAKSEYPLALKFHFKALKLYEEINFKPGIATVKVGVVSRSGLSHWHLRRWYAGLRSAPYRISLPELVEADRGQ